MTAPAWAAQAADVRDAAVKGYTAYLIECAAFGITGRPFRVWWERYAEDYIEAAA